MEMLAIQYSVIPRVNVYAGPENLHQSPDWGAVIDFRFIGMITPHRTVFIADMCPVKRFDTVWSFLLCMSIEINGCLAI